MDHPMDDPKEIVRRGYDAVAGRYADWAPTVRTVERARYTDLLLQALPTGAEVLELGCGNGWPTTAALSADYAVTAVDISEVQAARARANAPAARVLCADMTTLAFPAASFDAVTAFYSLFHIPREEQGGMLARIAVWLRPSGLLVATFGAWPDPAGYEEDWLSAPMFWSSWDLATTLELVRAAGLTVLRATEETADEDGEAITFLWVVAQKPGFSDVAQVVTTS